MTTQEILEAARAAKTVVALASSETRTHALWAMSDWLCHPENMEAILAANAEDMAAAKGHISDVMLDRLALTEERIGAMARGILEVAALPDPIGAVDPIGRGAAAARQRVALLFLRDGGGRQRPDGAARNAPGHHSPDPVQPAAGRGDPFARGGAGRRGAGGRRGENLREQEQLDFIDFTI